MGDVQFQNFATRSGSSCFDAVWKLSRACKKAGFIYKASGNGTTKDTSGVAANDLWGGNTDPATDVYAGTINGAGPNIDAAKAWWCGQGPTILRVAMQTLPGAFVRGEKVTQAATSS